MAAGRRRKSYGSETKDFITQSTEGPVSLRFSLTPLTPQSHTATWVDAAHAVDVSYS